MAIEQNSGAINYPGTYKDPVSGAELEVSTEPGADALVRLGWEFVKEYVSPQEQARREKVDAEAKAKPRKTSADVEEDVKSNKKEKESK